MLQLQGGVHASSLSAWTARVCGGERRREYFIEVGAWVVCG